MDLSARQFHDISLIPSARRRVRRCGWGSGFIHGEAYTVGHGGSVLLGDRDEPALGPRELDLATTIQGGIRFGRSQAELDAFVDAYGYDPRGWPGLATLVGMSEAWRSRR